MIDELAQTYAHYVALRRELSLWVEQSIRRDGPDKNQGGEDEANFALAFFPHYLVSGDERIAVRFRSLVSKICWRRAQSTRWAISFCWRATISFAARPRESSSR